MAYLINMADKKTFGPGYRSTLIDDRSLQFNPVVEEKERAVEIDIVDNFRMQCISGDPDAPDAQFRWRSDVSMIFHADDTVKKIGVDGYNYLTNSRRTKTSDVQSAYDSMSDDLLLETVKSRYIQKPSELLAWSDVLNETAQKLIDDEEERQKQLEIDAAAKLAASAVSSDGKPSAPETPS